MASYTCQWATSDKIVLQHEDVADAHLIVIHPPDGVDALPSGLVSAYERGKSYVLSTEVQP